MSTWHDLVTASLIGTERAVVPAAGIPGLSPAVDDTGDPAAVLLDRAALLTAARRAGRQADRAEPLPVCEPDPRPAMSPAADRRLARMLSGEYPELLTEWLTAVAARGLRLSPHLLPTLLDRARRALPADTGLPRLLAEAGGPRARWLARLNPDWEHSVEEPATDGAWRLGDARQRRGYLTSLLARDPDAARGLITGGWAAVGAAERAMFLSVLADGLGPADEPLLETALEDRAEDVRRWAAYLLARLPGSALGQRMAERALRYVWLEHSAQGPRLSIGPPRRPDAALQRDGITSRPDLVRVPLESRSQVLLEVLARTPLRAWTDGFGLAPPEIVALPSGGWAPVLFVGWSRAATAQDNRDWMSALISQALTGRRPGATAEIEALRQLVRRADPGLGAPGATPESAGAPDAPPPIRDAVRVLRFRYTMLKELDNG